MSETGGVVDGEPISLVALIVELFVFIAWMFSPSSPLHGEPTLCFQSTAIGNPVPIDCWAQLFNNTQWLLYILIPLFPFMMFKFYSDAHSSIAAGEPLLRPKFGFSFGKFAETTSKLFSEPKGRYMNRKQEEARGSKIPNSYRAGSQLPAYNYNPYSSTNSNIPINRTINLSASNYRVISSVPE